MSVLHELDDDVLLLIASKLTPVSLAMLCCTSERMRSLGSTNKLWQHFSVDRWRSLNWRTLKAVPLVLDWSQDGGVGPQPEASKARSTPSFHKLYSSNNGWTHKRLHRAQHETGNCECTFYQPPLQSDSCATNSVYVLRSYYLEPVSRCYLDVWNPELETAVPSYKLPRTYSALTMVAQGMLAAACSEDGVIQVLPAPSDAPETQACSTWRQPANCGPMTDLRYCPEAQQLYAFHEATGTQTGRASINSWDAASGQNTSTVFEFMDQYELACFCIPNQQAAANELVAGAVSADWCHKCTGLLYTLCCHKSTAKLAALCVFDARAGLHMVQRYSMHHRSLYPHMTCAREHYIFTSHVGSPLAVWDRRQMSHTVYEEEYLGNFPRPEVFAGEVVPFPLPIRPAVHQGLYLDTDEDQLIGRAENGMLWLWDLSSCLGWQKNGPCGTWMQSIQDRQNSAQAAEKGSRMLPLEAGFCKQWPTMLGAVPCDTEDGEYECRPNITIQNGRTFPITCLTPACLPGSHGTISCFRPCP